MSFNLLQDCNDMDCDMSSTDHAVLMVLCRFANENGGDCFPSTAEIARCSHFATIPVRKALASLQAAGWIKAEQKPGLKRYFTVDAARIRSAVATKAKPLQDLAGGIDQHPRIDQYPPVDQHPRINQYPDPVSINTPTPYQSIPRKEQEKNKEEDTYCDPASFETVSQSASDYGFNLEAEKEKPKKKAKAAKKAALDFYGLPESLVADWKANRKGHPLTQTAINGFKREADAAGVTLEDAVRVSIERGWRGVKAEWLANVLGGSAKPAENIFRADNPFSAHQPIAPVRKSEPADDMGDVMGRLL